MDNLKNDKIYQYLINKDNKINENISKKKNFFVKYNSYNINIGSVYNDINISSFSNNINSGSIIGFNSNITF